MCQRTGTSPSQIMDAHTGQRDIKQCEHVFAGGSKGKTSAAVTRDVHYISMDSEPAKHEPGSYHFVFDNQDTYGCASHRLLVHKECGVRAASVG